MDHAAATDAVAHSNLENQKFLELQYLTLREEIKNSKANMFRIVVGGAAVIPAAQSLANNFQIGAITLALPLIVVVLVLIFLTENHAMMRAGAYLLEHYEASRSDVVGWETWLSSSKGPNKKRTVDKMLVFAFAVLASSYFMVSVVMAARYALQEFGQHGQYLIAGGYFGVGIVLVFILYSQAQTNTDSLR
jgi:fucose permease